MERVEVELVYPGVENGEVKVNDATGYPEFVPCGSVTFLAKGNIIYKDITGEHSVSCNGDICSAYYSTGDAWHEMLWSSFDNGWVESMDAGLFTCRLDPYTVNARVVYKTAEGTKSADFVMSCAPQVIVKPKERGVAFDAKDVDVYEVIVKNPANTPKTWYVGMENAVEGVDPTSWLSYEPHIEDNERCAMLEMPACGNQTAIVHLSHAARRGSYKVRFLLKEESCTGSASAADLATLNIYLESLPDFGIAALAIGMAGALALFMFAR